MLSLHHGDITKLRVECIVNAANEAGLGCFTPNHPCIDNAIHRAAGPGLYRECSQWPEVRPGVRIPTGTAKLSAAYNLPSRYIIHAVGPSTSTKSGANQGEDFPLLAKTYEACLDLAKQHGIRDIAFCCISTGIFGHDKKLACQVAIDTCARWLLRPSNQQHGDGSSGASTIRNIIFVTFLDEDKALYERAFYRGDTPFSRPIHCH